MSKERFLLWMLATIFALQGALFVGGLYMCANNGGLKSCPEIGRRYEQTFGVMIATVLALLSGKVPNKE